jgi:hypothetical protein
MSNKTIFKRIALVAVTALGAGVLSVAPASAANNTAVGSTANANTVVSVLNVATVPSITGLGVVSAVAQVSGASADNKSLGLLANSTTQTTESLTSTATMRSDGEIVFYTKGIVDVATTFVVAGGTIERTATEASSLDNISADRSTFVTSRTSAAGTGIALGIKPNAGVSSFTVSMYESASLTTATDAKVADVQSGVISKGTLKQRYVVTVASTSASGVYSAADSYIAGATSPADEAETNVDATDSLAIKSTAAAQYAYININLRDAYDVSLDGGKGALIISGTNGAPIAYDADSGAVSSLSASNFNLTQVSSTSAAGTIYVGKPADRAGKSFSTTVSISWNGVVVGTKTVRFLGEVATLTVTPRRIADLDSASVDSSDAFRVTYLDDAGNDLRHFTLAELQARTKVVSSTTNNIVTGAVIGSTHSSTDLAKGTLTCAAGTSRYLGGGTAQLQLQHVNTESGTVVKSNVWTATCQGDPYSYTASFDKASYTPGSIATLTITFKDRDGDIANGYDTVGASSLITVTGGPSATAVTIPAATDKADGGTGMQGIKTFQFVVGTTEGDFVAVVSVPDVNTRNSSQANQSVPYSVKSATTVVTNADVLKSIVSLIASINKQIQALQKLILKR